MKFDCIITARMTSTRLPGKIMKKIRNKKIIELLYERVKQSKLISNIIIATTKNKSDDILVKFLKKKYLFFRGDEKNVTKRVIDTAKKFKTKNIVLITGDCPLIDKDLIDQCIRVFVANKADYVNNCNIRTYPDGLDVQVFGLSSIIKSYKLILKDTEKEHVTLSLRNNSSKFKTINILAGKKLNEPKIFLTLDEAKDFEVIKKIYEYFWKNNEFSSKDIIDYVKKNRLYKINNKIQRKGDN